MVWYRVKVKMKRTSVASPRYGRRRLMKGRTYEVRRKLTPSEARAMRRRKNDRYKVLSVKKY